MSRVFISHRSTDATAAERLAIELRTAGHTVWLDEWNIGLGDSIVARMNEGLTASSHVIICYSSSGVDSPWMGREWMSALASQLNGSGIKLLPVLISGSRPPMILEDLKYADLASDWARGMKELMRAL